MIRMLDRIRFTNKKIFAIFAVLFIANLWFFKIYFSHMDIDMSSFLALKNLSLIFSSIIIFAFISSKLPMLRNLGDSYLYDVIYFMILAVLSIFISYYNSSLNQYLKLGSFLDMFNVLAISLILMIISIHLKPFKEIINGNRSVKNLMGCMVIFSVLGIISSLFTTDGTSLANVRAMTILIGSLFGGPMVGIPSAIVSALFRLVLGGPTAMPCAVLTVLTGVIGSAIYVLNGGKFLNSPKSVILMFLVIGVEMLLLILMLPDSIAFEIVDDIYQPVLFTSVIGIVLFKLVIKTPEERAKHKDGESEIEKLKGLLAEQEERITRLEDIINGRRGNT